MNAAKDEAERLASCPEINLRNFDVLDVEKLNDWAIDAHTLLRSMAAEIERLTTDRDEWKEAAIGAVSLGNAECKKNEALRTANADLERSETQLIEERDRREEVINQLCDAVLGVDRYEWSSAYSFADAVEEVEVKTAVLDKEVSELYELRTANAKLVQELEDAMVNAKRYLWLRASHPDNPAGISVGRERLNGWGNLVRKVLRVSQLDKTIDGAIKQGEQHVD